MEAAGPAATPDELGLIGGQHAAELGMAGVAVIIGVTVLWLTRVPVAPATETAGGLGGSDEGPRPPSADADMLGTGKRSCCAL